ncbi:MAG TPA: GNAT family N-acetyltransferase [Solirubrobacteraceae bacterium]|jgi:GNAT superfamily N-acetyltransferase|nr:GNAT family N-acetyltransferase [Solirubrobacteraceae bacterium]
MELRRATPADAAALTANVADGFGSYLEWAPTGWTPPLFDDASVARLAAGLAGPYLWCVMALDGDETAGHAGLAPFTTEEPEPAPSGVIYLRQMFVRSRWRGSGVAARLMAAAAEEARRRELERMTLWTPRGAGRARRFYEREGWSPTGRAHEDSSVGLPTVEYSLIVDS